MPFRRFPQTKCEPVEGDREQNSGGQSEPGPSSPVNEVWHLELAPGRPRRHRLRTLPISDCNHTSSVRCCVAGSAVTALSISINVLMAVNLPSAPTAGTQAFQVTAHEAGHLRDNL